MKNPQVKTMDIVSPSRVKTQRRKSISSGIPSSDSREKDKDKKLPHVVHKSRRASIDSTVIGLGKLSAACQKEKGHSSEISNGKFKERRNSYSTQGKKEKEKTTSKESKYSLGKVSTSPKHGSSSPSELKPILKSCPRLTALHASVSLEDVSARAEDKVSQLPDSSKFCYRLPLASTQTRKSVSFREDDLNDVRRRPRRYSSPSLQLPPSLNFPASKEFNDAVNSS